MEGEGGGGSPLSPSPLPSRERGLVSGVGDHASLSSASLRALALFRQGSVLVR